MYPTRCLSSLSRRALSDTRIALLRLPRSRNPLSAKRKEHKVLLRSSTVRSSLVASTVSFPQVHQLPISHPVMLNISSTGAILIPTNASHAILKIPWNKLYLQVGRGPYSLAGNDIVLQEKRISNRHCQFTLGIKLGSGDGTSNDIIRSWREGEADAEVWVEDMRSSNGTFVSIAFCHTICAEFGGPGSFFSLHRSMAKRSTCDVS